MYSVTLEDSSLKKLVEDDTFLRNVQLNKFYNYFNLSYGGYVNNYRKYDNILENIMHYAMYIGALNNKLQLILNDWNKLFQNSEKSYKNINYCDYLNYWLYDKLINTNLDSNIKKKTLFEFFEYYDSIKDKLRNKMNKKNNQYCDYIRDSFKLYNEMKKENVYDKYSDKICQTEKEQEKYLEDRLQLDKKENNLPLVGAEGELEYKSLLEKLAAYKIYEVYNRKENIDDYCCYCDDIFMLEKDYPGINELCFIRDNDAVVKLLNAGYNISSKIRINHCYTYYNPKINFGEWKEEKYLHDYFKSYNFINCDASSNKEQCNNYCKYVYFIKGLYMKHIKNCCNYIDHYTFVEHCSDYFKCDRNYYPNDLLCKLKCNIEEFPNSSKGISRHVKNAKENIFLSSNSVFAFFFIYKFTPFGYFLHKKVLNKKQIEKNFYDEDTQNLSHHHRKRENTNSKSRRYRLAYNSV
ncbi:PIR Superfamily Protein [Plasmodium ovale curtisi]|uniref:PIR Superfamily Protein n=1 Tax=Plasmodium ovale curtisi TaxID=864141 RepID=A0A1A8X4W8_PLAOA|nr:PIR Superfamily Protein [Plasmodium ovale curtisi]